MSLPFAVAASAEPPGPTDGRADADLHRGHAIPVSRCKLVGVSPVVLAGQHASLPAIVRLMDDWTALRLVLAVQRAGSLTAAATRLGIDHSTAYRRLKTMEQGLGVQLFDRLPGGVYRSTEAGARLA